ncbi:MAG: hypothetical protein MSG78_04550 [Clostridiales bacterium]|nr:hypothetical protein [Clostridiales bacterium]
MENSQSNFVKIIKEICKEEDIQLISYSSDWAFQLEKNGVKNFILGYQFGLNRAVSQQISADKAVASEVMTQNHVPNVEHRCFMAPHMFRFTGENGNWKQMRAMLEKYKDIVCKDNEGTGGYLVFHVKTQRQLEEAAQQIFASADAMAISPYYEIEKEYRVILLDEQVQIAFEKKRKMLVGDGVSTIRTLYANYLLDAGHAVEMLPSAVGLDRVLEKGEVYLFNWKHNLGQGAEPDVLEKLPESLKQLAIDAARALNLRFASIDIVKCNGEWRVLEVNSGVMMENLASNGIRCYELAKEIYRKAIKKML